MSVCTPRRAYDERRKLLKSLGNATDWVGGEMTGGTIHIRGNAGGSTSAAAYRGGMSGMSGGDRSCRRFGRDRNRNAHENAGLIAIRGPVRDFAGLQMKGGTIVLMRGVRGTYWRLDANAAPSFRFSHSN